MKKIDYHMHTYFSTDSKANPRDYVLKAIEMGLDEICFTDHQDFNYPNISFDLNVQDYLNQISKLKQEFKHEITIKIGVEIGLNRKYANLINHFINSYPFDYVIGSIHAIGDQEFFEPANFFNGLTQDEADDLFFKETLECVKLFDCFDCLGHLDFIQRYGPYKKRLINYEKHSNLIDEIFKVLISKNKGIEVNTSGYKLNILQPFPNYTLIHRYYQLGGKIITIGSDSHDESRIGEYIVDVCRQLKEIGFNDVTTFSQRKVG